jgi:hypothetical protein
MTDSFLCISWLLGVGIVFGLVLWQGGMIECFGLMGEFVRAG